MLAKFDELVTKRKALESWWKLGSTIAGYGNRMHVLRVDMCAPSMVSYCGQAFAGDKNYHDAPKWFAKCIQEELQERSQEIAEAAYRKAIARLNEEIESHRDAVEKELAAM